MDSKYAERRFSLKKKKKKTPIVQRIQRSKTRTDFYFNALITKNVFLSIAYEINEAYEILNFVSFKIIVMLK